ncbi:hypothetical protein RR46_04965 [Papilio xuthus]|uniref:Uncharacterized protein n=1 Tax=Papilio xuthus TaxID=66420 RepID=A0A194Q099_PAPXU|nr:hypothetical protein RR46_04965 [Papilio xuthus]
MAQDDNVAGENKMADGNMAEAPAFIKVKERREKRTKWTRVAGLGHRETEALFRMSLTPIPQDSAQLRTQFERQSILNEDLCVATVINNSSPPYWQFDGAAQTGHKSINVLEASIASARDNDVIKNIHEMKIVTIISRTMRRRITHYNEAYIIMVGNFDIFKDEFENLTKEKYWNPNVYFLIVFKEIDAKLLNNLFHILLHHHIFDVVVINSMDNKLFTYNPFDDYNCGKSFTSIIKLENCAMNLTNLYFYKFTTGLKKCNFNAVVSDWPPYVIIPEKNLGPVKLLGSEQYIMNILSKLEGFNINYTYKDNAEEFSVIDNDMEATGSLSLIQNKNTDIIFGGMLLTYERAAAFSYFCGHHAFVDQLDIVVKKTGPLPIWKNLYLEFTYVVWILLALTFFIFFTVLITFCIKEKCRTVLIMWSILLQQSCRLYYKFKVKCFIFQWVLFSCLLNIYYQSNLMGLTTHVSHNYQISNDKDLQDFKLQSCVSLVIKEVVRITTGKEYESGKYCDKVLNSLDTVSEDDTKYTVSYSDCLKNSVPKASSIHELEVIHSCRS